MKSAITLCRVPEAATGPFVFHGKLEDGFAAARRHGFDAVELFLTGPDEIEPGYILSLASTHRLKIAAVGTGAGMLRHGLTLTDADPDRRKAALDFLLAMVRFGGALGAPAILGSMQGRSAGNVDRDTALDWLATALRTAGETAAPFGVPFLYEPLNRYETNLFNRIGEARRWLDEKDIANVLLLADLFHMNIEETNIEAALRKAAPRLGHVHFADSNRRAVGFGHTDLGAAIEALREMGYSGYLSAEILPLPDAEAAATRTIESFHSLTGNPLRP